MSAIHYLNNACQVQVGYQKPKEEYLTRIVNAFFFVSHLALDFADNICYLQSRELVQFKWIEQFADLTEKQVEEIDQAGQEIHLSAHLHKIVKNVIEKMQSLSKQSIPYYWRKKHPELVWILVAIYEVEFIRTFHQYIKKLRFVNFNEKIYNFILEKEQPLKELFLKIMDKKEFDFNQKLKEIYSIVK